MVAAGTADVANANGSAGHPHNYGCRHARRIGEPTGDWRATVQRPRKTR